MAKPTTKSTSKKLTRAKQPLKQPNRPVAKKVDQVQPTNEVIEISTDDDDNETRVRESSKASTGTSRRLKSNSRAGKSAKKSRVASPPANSDDTDNNGQTPEGPRSGSANVADLWKRFGHGGSVDVPVKPGSSTTRVVTHGRLSSASSIKRPLRNHDQGDLTDGGKVTNEPQAKRRALDNGGNQPTTTKAGKADRKNADRQGMLDEMDGEESHLLQLLKGALQKSGLSKTNGKNFFQRVTEALEDEAESDKNPFIDDEAMEIDVDEEGGDEEGIVLDANGYDANDGFVVPDDDSDEPEADGMDNDTSCADGAAEVEGDDGDGDDDDDANDGFPPLAELFNDDDDDQDTVMDTHARKDNAPNTLDDILDPNDEVVLKVKNPLKTAKEILRVRKEVSLGNLKKKIEAKGNTKVPSGLLLKKFAAKNRVNRALDEYVANELDVGQGASTGSASLLPAAKLATKASRKVAPIKTPLGSEIPAPDDDAVGLEQDAETVDPTAEEFDDQVAQDLIRARVASMKNKVARLNGSQQSAPNTSNTTTPTACKDTVSKKNRSGKTTSSRQVTLQQLVASQSTGSRTLGDFASVKHPQPGGKVVEGRHGWLYDTVRRGTVKAPSVNELDAVAVNGIMAPLYRDCQPLLKAALTPWLKAKGKGLVRFDAWVTQCPAMIAEQAFGAMNFVRLGSIVNPTHIDIRLLYAQEVAGGNSRSFIFIDDEVATFMSSIYVEYSQLNAASTVGLKIKSIRGVFHEMDYQRMVSVISMTFNEFDMNAQLARDSIQFVTRPVSKKFGGGKAKAVDGMFNSASTVEDGAEGSSVSAGNAYALDTTEDVPVYDARESPTFDFTTDIGDRDSLLPRFEAAEVPQGSFAVVGYTVNTYLNQDGETTLSFNIMWVIVCGVPGKGKHVAGKGKKPAVPGPKTFTMADLE